MSGLVSQARPTSAREVGLACETMSGQAPPPPDPVYTFRPHAGEIATLKYVNLETRGTLVSGTVTGQLSLWDLGTKRQSWVDMCCDPIIAVDCWASGKIISQCHSGVAEVWNLEAQCKECSFSIANPGFCRLATLVQCREGGCLPSELISGCFAVADKNYGKVNIYSLATQKLVSCLSVQEPKSKGRCMCVRWYVSPDRVVYLLAGFEDGSVVLWDCRNNTSELTTLKLFSEPVLCMDFEEGRLCGVAGSPLKSLEVFSLSSSQGQLQKKYSVELRNAGVADVAVRADGRIMASGGWDGRIRVFGWKKGKPLAILNYHSATVNCVTFSGTSAFPGDSNLLACGSKDERISLWRLY